MPQLIQLQGYISKGALTVGSNAVKASAGQLGGYCVYDATEDATLTLYDDPDSANGTVLLKVATDQSAGVFSITDVFPAPINFALGCYCVLAGTNASCYIYYR